MNRLRGTGPALFLLKLALLVFLSGCIHRIADPPVVSKEAWDEFVRGVRYYEQGRFTAAADIFLEMIDSYPGTPLLADAQWYLAKSYDASGRREAAERELKVFLKNYPENSHHEEARSLLFRLENLHRKTVAAYWDPGRSNGPEEESARLRKRRVNTLLIPATETIPNRNELTLNEDVPPVLRGDLLESIQSARRAGFRVIAKISLREIDALVLAHPEWRDRRLDAGRKETEEVWKLDLFNRQAREEILEVYRGLARYPIDGIYVDGISYEIEEGWTPSASHLYQTLFFERPDPALFFNEPARLAGKQPPFPPASQFWYWVGWRSRFVGSFLREIQEKVQATSPGIQFGVAIPEALLLDPRKALAEGSLDLLELKRSKFDFYHLISQGDRSSPLPLFSTLGKYRLSPQEIWVESASGIEPSEIDQFPFQGFFLLNP